MTDTKNKRITKFLRELRVFQISHGSVSQNADGNIFAQTHLIDNRLNRGRAICKNTTLLSYLDEHIDRLLENKNPSLKDAEVYGFIHWKPGMYNNLYSTSETTPMMLVQKDSAFYLLVSDLPFRHRSEYVRYDVASVPLAFTLSPYFISYSYKTEIREIPLKLNLCISNRLSEGGMSVQYEGDVTYPIMLLDLLNQFNDCTYAQLIKRFNVVSEWPAVPLNHEVSYVKSKCFKNTVEIYGLTTHYSKAYVSALIHSERDFIYKMLCKSRAYEISEPVKAETSKTYGTTNKKVDKFLSTVNIMVARSFRDLNDTTLPISKVLCEAMKLEMTIDRHHPLYVNSTLHTFLMTNMEHLESATISSMKESSNVHWEVGIVNWMTDIPGMVVLCYRGQFTLLLLESYKDAHYTVQGSLVNKPAANVLIEIGKTYNLDAIMNHHPGVEGSESMNNEASKTSDKSIEQTEPSHNVNKDQIGLGEVKKRPIQFQVVRHPPELEKLPFSRNTPSQHPGYGTCYQHQLNDKQTADHSPRRSFNRYDVQPNVDKPVVPASEFITVILFDSTKHDSKEVLSQAVVNLFPDIGLGDYVRYFQVNGGEPINVAHPHEIAAMNLVLMDVSNGKLSNLLRHSDRVVLISTLPDHAFEKLTIVDNYTASKRIQVLELLRQ